MVKCLFAWPGLVMSTLESLLFYYPLSDGEYQKQRTELLLFILLQFSFYEDRCTDGYIDMHEQMQI